MPEPIAGAENAPLEDRGVRSKDDKKLMEAYAALSATSDFCTVSAATMDTRHPYESCLL